MLDKNRIIADYISQLRSALKGSDPALIMDAVNDAREYLYNEVEAQMAIHPDTDQRVVSRQAIDKFGSPEEVAAAFRRIEVQVNRAFGKLKQPPPKGALKRWLGIAADPKAYTALVYLFLSCLTGVIYGIWVTYGLSITLLACTVIIGIPIGLFFFSSLRAFVLMESRLIETLLGTRMPRRPVFIRAEGNMLSRFWQAVRSARNWKNFLYLASMMPLGIAYGLLVMCWLALILEFLLVPFFPALADAAIYLFTWTHTNPGLWAVPFTAGIAFLLLVLLLHVANTIGALHARYAKWMLVGRTETPYKANTDATIAGP